MNNCSICNGQLIEDLIINRDDYSGQRFNIQICGLCGFGKTLLDKNINLANFYPTEYYGDERKRFNWFIERLVEFFRLSRVLFIKKNNKRKHKEKNKILDIGCGRATELQLLNKQGWECYGTEHSIDNLEDLKEKGIKIFKNEKLDDCGFSDKKFDVITLWHSLEHVIEFESLFLEVKRILKSDGCLIIEVPNFNSWQARINKSRWIYTEAPRHTQHFTRLSLENIINKNFFYLESISTFSLEYGPIGFITNLFNIISTEKNFLFKLLFKKQKFRFVEKTFYKMFLNYLVFFVLLIPFTVLGIIFEFVSILFQRGAVLRVVAKKR